MSICQLNSNFHAVCFSDLSFFVYRPYFNPCLGDVPEAPLRSHEKGHGAQRPLRLPDRPHYLQLQQQARPVFVTRYRLHPSPIHRGMQNNRFVVIFFLFVSCFPSPPPNHSWISTLPDVNYIRNVGTIREPTVIDLVIVASRGISEYSGQRSWEKKKEGPHHLDCLAQFSNTDRRDSSFPAGTDVKYLVPTLIGLLFSLCI